MYTIFLTYLASSKQPQKPHEEKAKLPENLCLLPKEKHRHINEIKDQHSNVEFNKVPYQSSYYIRCCHIHSMTTAFAVKYC